MRKRFQEFHRRDYANFFTKNFDSQITSTRDEAIKNLEQTYPFFRKLRRIHYRGIAYAMRDESPTKIMAQGGLYAHKPHLYLSATSEFNTGSVCLSTYFPICALFCPHQFEEYYLYAFHLDCVLYDMQDKYLQIISPGALVLPTQWQARRVIDRDHCSLQLGPVQGGEVAKVNDSFFNQYLSIDRLAVPLNISPQDPCDYPLEFAYESSKEFQECRNTLERFT